MIRQWVYMPFATLYSTCIPAHGHQARRVPGPLMVRTLEVISIVHAGGGQPNIVRKYNRDGYRSSGSPDYCY